MSTASTLRTLRDELRAELTERILPFWIRHTPDRDHGGFIGVIDGQGRPHPDADKGVVLNARILWAFSMATRHLDDPRYREMADRAYEALTGPFWDEEHGGVYWKIAPDGPPTAPRKQTYAQAFALYALAEYVQATECPDGEDRARRLFRLIERHAHDVPGNGYVEALGRTWTPIDDVRLGADDPNVPRTLNTTLHVLEAYTNLHRIWDSQRVDDRLDQLIDLFLNRMLDSETQHLYSFFDTSWNPKSSRISFGHDIEASWLLAEAGERLTADRTADVASVAVLLADAVLRDGGAPGNGLPYEATQGRVWDSDRHWWPQAEAIVGFLNAYQLSGANRFLEAANQVWTYVKGHLLDRSQGEWYYRVSQEGTPYHSENKVGPWKGPYHNARACFEVVKRTEKLAASTGETADMGFSF